MSLRLYDTLSRKVLPLAPAEASALRFYCCGPTVYGPAHIGNFRAFVLQDTLRRVLEMAGIPVHHVRNITDVDDKTIRQSQARGQALSEFTRTWLDRFHADTQALNLLPPHQEPGAVEHIPDMIALIQQLLEQGHAYLSDDGSVYFKVNTFADYGRLSRLDTRELRHGAGERDGQPIDADEYQRDSMADFVLWKARKPEDGENAWPSPWGPGRPGWHIECSAMSLKYLGEDFDLHSGGVDLCFPHHENEIAQSEAASGRPFCRHWFHIAHLQVDGHKMSKSEGNLYTLDDLRQRGADPADLRYLLLAGHYRKPLNFTFDSLDASRSALQRIARAEADLRATAGSPPPLPYEDSLPPPGSCADFGPFQDAFEALLDDLNIPGALGRLFPTLHALEKNRQAGTLTPDDALAAWRGLHRLLHALGLCLPAQETGDDAPEQIQDLARRRWEAKREKDFATADQLREELSRQGWTVKDARDGYTLHPA